MSPRIAEGEKLDRIADKLAELHDRKASGTFVIDLKDGAMQAAKFQAHERLDLTTPLECDTK